MHNLCLSFLLGITAVPREIESNAYAKFWEQIRCIMGNLLNLEWLIRPNFEVSTHFQLSGMAGTLSMRMAIIPGQWQHRQLFHPY